MTNEFPTAPALGDTRPRRRGKGFDGQECPFHLFPEGAGGNAGTSRS